MEWRVPLADLDYGEEEENAVVNVLRRKWLTMGGVTQEFETEFANLVQAERALAVSNATVALHLACLALGIGPGDEVIVPSLTFVATSNAVLYTGADVRFADVIGSEVLNISPESIEQNITPRTKALICVHYGGYPCRMGEIIEIARKHGLAVIEDAAHAPGATLEGKALGTWGDVGCFSFFSNKNLSVGEGGMVVTNRKDIADKVAILRSHGMTTLTWDRHKGHAHTYDVIDLGYNYRIDEIRSALGLVQLRKLPANNRRREALTRQYWERLQGTSLVLPFRQSAGVPAYHIFPVLLPSEVDRERFIQSMQDKRVQTSIHYPPIHHFHYYRQRYPGVRLERTEALASREVTLPLYPTMSQEAFEHVVRSVDEALESSQARLSTHENVASDVLRDS